MDKITFNAESLAKLVELVSKVIEKRGMIPIFDNVLFQVKDSVCVIIGRNSGTQMKTAMEIDSKTDFSFCIPSFMMINTLRALGKAETTLQLKARKNGSSYVIIKSERKKFSVDTVNPEHFSILDIPDQDNIIVDSSLFSEAVINASKVIREDDLRPQFSGVTLNVRDDKLVVIAPSNEISTRQSIPVMGDTLPDVIIPKSVGSWLSDLPIKGQLKIRSNGNQIYFRVVNVELITTLMDAKMIDLNKFLNDKEDRKRVVVNKQEMMDALKILSYYNFQENNIVKIIIHNDRMIIKAKDNERNNEGMQYIRVKNEGVSIEIGFAVKVLMKSISSITTEFIEMHLSKPSVHIFIDPHEDKGQPHQNWISSPCILE